MEYEIGIKLDRLEYKLDLLLKAAGYKPKKIEEELEPEPEEDIEEEEPDQDIPVKRGRQGHAPRAGK